MPFNVAIVGAGIAGLAAAIALSRDGHEVTVYERRGDTQQASGSGLQIQPSAIKILTRWGLLEGFKKVAHEAGSIKLMRYATGELVAEQQRKGSRGQWYCLRNALRQYLYDAAITSGATVLFKARVSSIDFATPSLRLENGTSIKADLIVGADGKNSFIRKTMFPGSEPELSDGYVFQFNIPRDAMYEEEYSKAYYEDPATRVYMGPTQWAFISVAPKQNIYDAQVILRDFGETGRDPNPTRLLEPLNGLELLGDALDKWSPEFKHTLAKATTFFKWRVALTPEIPTALAKSGKVILIGDSYHGIDPSAGFGTALSLEDSVELAAILRRASSPKELPALLSVFDKVMRERATAIGNYSAYMGALLGLPDSKMQQARDKAMKKFDPNSNLNAIPNIEAKYGSAEWQAYMDDYDPEKAVEEALRKYVKEVELPAGSVASRL